MPTLPRRSLILLAHLLVPVAVFFGMGARMARGDTGIDEYIYVGAVERLGDFMVRFPTGYFGYRFGYILPEQLVETILGPTVGFFAIRIALLGVFGWTLRDRGLRWQGPLLGTFVVASSPIVLRAVLDTYVDSLGVGFLLVGTGLLVAPSERPLVGRLQLIGAGFALALAWNANLVLLAPAVAIMAVAALESWVRSRSFSRGLDHGVFIFAGMLLCVSLALFWYGLRFGVWDLFGVSARQAGAETNDVFTDPNPTWFSYRQYLMLAPLGLTLGGLTALLVDDERQRRQILRLLAFTAVTLALFAWLQWVRGRPTLQLFYYACYPLSLVLALMAKSLATWVGRISTDRGRSIAALSTVALLLLGYVGLDQVKPRFAIVGLICLATIGLAAASVRSPRLRPGALAMIVLTSAWVTVSSPHDFPETSPGFKPDPGYDQILFGYEWRTLDVMHTTRNFARSLPMLPDERGQIRVWFDGEGDTHQISSALVHYSSALQIPGGNFLPELGTFERTRIEVDRPRFLVLLAAEEAHLQEGFDALNEAGFDYRVLWREDQSHGSSASFVVMLERNDELARDYPCYPPDGGGVPVPCG